MLLLFLKYAPEKLIQVFLFFPQSIQIEKNFKKHLTKERKPDEPVLYQFIQF